MRLKKLKDGTGFNMGWWSEDILGGDYPLDTLGDLAVACGLDIYNDDDCAESYYGYDFFKVKESFSTDKKVEELFNNISNNSMYSEDRNISSQVLALVMMLVGAPMVEARKAKFVKNISKDKWMKKDKKRKEIIETFIQEIEDYDGSPRLYKQKGLFESLKEKQLI